MQWHPEWRCQDNPFYFNIFNAFGKACLARHKHRKEQALSKNTAG
jgi:putative glutamine amidotransferase